MYIRKFRKLSYNDIKEKLKKKQLKYNNKIDKIVLPDNIIEKNTINEITNNNNIDEIKKNTINEINEITNNNNIDEIKKNTINEIINNNNIDEIEKNSIKNKEREVNNIHVVKRRSLFGALNHNIKKVTFCKNVECLLFSDTYYCEKYKDDLWYNENDYIIFRNNYKNYCINNRLQDNFGAALIVKD